MQHNFVKRLANIMDLDKCYCGVYSPERSKVGPCDC